MKKNILTLSFIIVFILILTIVVISQAPKNFPDKPFSFHIEKGSSMSGVATDLEAQHIISSGFLFKITAKILALNGGVKAGYYKFTAKENTIEIANRMVKGYERQEKIRVTIPEGTTVADMGYIFLKALPHFNAPYFVSIAKSQEGYLYPDTYDFFENTSADDIVATMKDTFNQKIKTIQSEISTSKHSLKDIVTMASIVEKEANSSEDRKIIAGILWKRIDEGMLLQVDPPFYYITQKTTPLTLADLKIDSPYNTYKYKGLPKGPIGSPSLDAIEATIQPTNSKYYFYLSGHDGLMHYAATYDGHLKNKSIYLK